MFAVVYTKNAQKTLLKMPRPTAQRIRQKIEEVATDPYQMHQNVKKLSNSDQFRLRVGSWRILYQIQDEKLVIVVVKVAPRGGAYKK